MNATLGAARLRATRRVIILDLARATSGMSIEELRAAGWEVELCPGVGWLLEAAVRHQPAAVVFSASALAPEDVAVLRLLKRAAPSLALIVVGPPDSLEFRRQLQEVNPSYYAVAPTDPGEIHDALCSVLRVRSS
jgi:DNA-binding NarL/FixJ family response regulator